MDKLNPVNHLLWDQIIRAMNAAKDLNSTEEYIDLLELIASEAIIRIAKIGEQECKKH